MYIVSYYKTHVRVTSILLQAIVTLTFILFAAVCLRDQYWFPATFSAYLSDL